MSSFARNFARLSVSIAFLLGFCGADLAAARPNLILIMADDFGYECVSANGGTSYRTPVLDRLASTGMRFERCYVQPLCTPTRVQLMTGLYNVRNYITFGEMDPHAVTFGHLLKQAGYATCIAGKWQLGRDPALPKTFGFDEHCLWWHMRRAPRYANPGLDVDGVQKNFNAGEYGPDLVNDYALDFITRRKDGPFFLYYPMMLTHDPFQPTPDSADWDPKAQGEKVNQTPRHFADMVGYMDKLIGKLVAHLDKLQIRDRTLILFVGDNGTKRGMRSMMGKRVAIGGKGSTNDAGMHVPLIANWPGRIPADKVSLDLVDSTDFLPTLCEAAGVAAPAGIDGRSFLPQLRGQPGAPRAWSYCWYSPRGEIPEEFAFNSRYRLERGGGFSRIADDATAKPLDRKALDAEAAAALRVLQAALDRYKDARPAKLKESSDKIKRKRTTQSD